MMTQSAGQPVAASRGGGTGGRAGSGGGRTRGHSGNQGALTWWNSQIHTRGREANVEVELWNHVMVRAGYAAYTDRFHELSSPKNGSIKKNLETEGIGRTYKDEVKTITKMTRNEMSFAQPQTMFSGGHFAKDCRVVPRNVNPVNARNPVARTYYECGSTDHIKTAISYVDSSLRAKETIRTKSCREKPEEKMRQLMSAKAKEKEQEEIVGVKDFPETREEHDVAPKTSLELLKKEKLYAKFSKCELWLREV
ncbi:hypothetical protein Tco_0864981 [Tanacetum coccineum]